MRIIHRSSLPDADHQLVAIKNGFGHHKDAIAETGGNLPRALLVSLPNMTSPEIIEAIVPFLTYHLAVLLAVSARLQALSLLCEAFNSCTIFSNFHDQESHEDSRLGVIHRHFPGRRGLYIRHDLPMYTSLESLEQKGARSLRRQHLLPLVVGRFRHLNGLVDMAAAHS